MGKILNWAISEMARRYAMDPAPFGMGWKRFIALIIALLMIFTSMLLRRNQMNQELAILRARMLKKQQAELLSKQQDLFDHSLMEIRRERLESRRREEAERMEATRAG